MNLAAVDWVVLLALVGSLGAFALYTRRYTRGVADYLAANRSGGRYMMAISVGMANVGAISFVALFEMYYQAGFTPNWWRLMLIPTGLIISLSGWVFYRFRETRCLTMAQFFEIRYSKRVRVFAGILTFVSGVLNFAIFPAAGARFFIYFMGLPERFGLFGIEIPTFLVMMLVLEGAAILVVMGGQVAVMVTDCVQGILFGIALIVLSLVILSLFNWSHLADILQQAPADASMVNPYKTSRMRDFSIWFFMINIFWSFYGYMSWQGTGGYSGAALSPHEAKMAGILGRWRAVPLDLVAVLLALAAAVFLTHPAFAFQRASAQAVLAQVENPDLVRQVRVSVALAHFLPMGVRGLLCAVMFFALITTDDTYIHAWGSIFIQDVVLPFRKKPLTPEQHLRLLRLSAIGVATFAILFSAFYVQSQAIFMFQAITAAIVSGMGAIIIFGLYWRRGTAAAAVSALAVGAALPALHLIAKQMTARYTLSSAGPAPLSGWWNACCAAVAQHPAIQAVLSINEQYFWFLDMCLCILIYVTVSLLTAREKFNLEQMLHRGRYAVDPATVAPADSLRKRWYRFIGIDHEFTRWDKIIAIGTVAWNLAWFGVFIVLTVANFTLNPGDRMWQGYWKFWIWCSLSVSIPVAIWFTIGGIWDVQRFFRRMATLKRDERDDGTVVGHRSRAEAPAEE